MASQPEPDVVALVRKLLESGQTFSISLEDPDSPAVKSVLEQGHDFAFSPDFAQGDGDCIEWIEVAGRGLICKKHKGE
jgi:hypothetical protein